MRNGNGTNEPSIGRATNRTGPRDQTVRTFDPHAVQSVPTEVAYAISETLRVDSADVGPLHENVNCEALDRLFAGDVTDQSFSISFEYDSLLVTVSNDGRISVEY